MKKRLFAGCAASLLTAVALIGSGPSTALAGNDWETATSSALGNDWESAPHGDAKGNDGESAPGATFAGNDWE